MTKITQKQIEQEVYSELALAFRFEGIKLEELSQEERNQILIGFQTGVGYVDKKRREMEAKYDKDNKRLLDEIPF